jgi:hypothetical protein
MLFVKKWGESHLGSGRVPYKYELVLLGPLPVWLRIRWRKQTNPNWEAYSCHDRDIGLLFCCLPVWFQNKDAREEKKCPK